MICMKSFMGLNFGRGKGDNGPTTALLTSAGLKAIRDTVRACVKESAQPPLKISSSKVRAPLVPNSSGNVGPSPLPAGLLHTSAVRKQPVVVSAVSVRPKPGLLPDLAPVK